MGVHSGPVNEITDLNELANIAGAGINIAQRVMDCGDAGHILLSKHVAEDLEDYDRIGRDFWAWARLSADEKGVSYSRSRSCQILRDSQL
jgi:class 3 adenylate cyclase